MQFEAQVKRCFRLTRSDEIKRVRRSGKSFAHPLVVLYISAADHASMRVGVVAGRMVGSAVARNRAKRLLREAMRSLLPEIKPGWDLLIIARARLPDATMFQAQEALSALLRQAGLLAKAENG